MIEESPIPTDHDSPETLKGCLWALSTVAAVIVFTLSAWLSIERVQVIMATQRAAAAVKERDAASREHAETIKALNDKLIKADVARLTAESKAQAAAENAARGAASTPQPESATISIQPVQAAAPLPGPSIRLVASFIEEHLFHMTGPVEAQLSDYADEVDFHDKPHASLRVIENERRQWTQKFPVRQIFKPNQPRIDVIQVPGGGWLATAMFDWRWQFKSRTGAVVTGITRDTWKIVPAAHGFKIIAEHSVDPVSGRSKD